MATNSTIEWTDASWNPVAGCSIVSPGCHNCYAMKMAKRLEAIGQEKYRGLTKAVNGKPVWTGKVHCDEASLSIPLGWRKPKRIFVNSMSDLFHESVPDEFIRRVFAVMSLAGQHTFQVLTKRAERMAAWFADDENNLAACQAEWCVKHDYPQTPTGRSRIRNARAINGTHKGFGDGNYWPLPNVWLGVSAEDQKRAAERIPWLLKTPAAVRFVSAEPLLGSIDLPLVCGHESSTGTGTPDVWRCDGCGQLSRLVADPDGPIRVVPCNGTAHKSRREIISPGAMIDWVVVGGESGGGSRPVDRRWVRSIRDQCQSAGVPFFFKQWGDWLPALCDGARDNPKGQELNCSLQPVRVGKKAAGRLLDGRTWDEFPAKEAAHA